MICVSGCFFWHGYDRLIEGMNTYYQNCEMNDKVYLHVVGQGECFGEYKVLADEYGMTDKYVFFYGKQIGKELDTIYDKSNIGIDVLGAHRKGMRKASSLKAREYAAKGMPMIVANDLDIYREDTKQYIKMFPADDSPINIKDVVDFYHEIYEYPENITMKIRQTFYPYCAWDFVYKPVLDYINL